MMPTATARSGSISIGSAVSVSWVSLSPSAERRRSSSSALEVLVEHHPLQVVRGVELAMHLGDGGDTAHGVGERGLHIVVRRRGLQMQQRGDDLQAVADAVIDLAQQHFALGGERGVAVPRRAHLRFGGFLGLAHARAVQRAGNGHRKQGDEIALGVLDQVVGGAGLQRGHGDAAVERGGDEHHRRRVLDRADPRQRLQPVEARHVLVERDHVDAALANAGEPGLAIGCMLDDKTLPLQPALHQPRESGIVVDIERGWCFLGHAAGGT